MNSVQTAMWVGFLKPIFLVMTLYFSFQFFQHSKKDELAAANNSKWYAVICLALALILPTLLNIILFWTMTQE